MYVLNPTLVAPLVHIERMPKTQSTMSGFSPGNHEPSLVQKYSKGALQFETFNPDCRISLEQQLETVYFKVNISSSPMSSPVTLHNKSKHFSTNKLGKTAVLLTYALPLP